MNRRNKLAKKPKEKISSHNIIIKKMETNENTNKKIKKSDINGNHSKFGDEELSCRDLSTEMCSELRVRKFSNKKTDLFLEVRSLEERYKYELSRAKERSAKIIEENKKKNGIQYRKELENRKKELMKEIEKSKEKVIEDMENLKAQENMMISQIDMIYTLNKEKLVKKILSVIEMDF